MFFSYLACGAHKDAEALILILMSDVHCRCDAAGQLDSKSNTSVLGRLDVDKTVSSPDERNQTFFKMKGPAPPGVQILPPAI